MSSTDFDHEPRIDQAAITQIRQLESVRPGLLRHLVEIFERNAVQLLGELDGHVAAGDLSPLRVRFHSLKGTSGSIGARRLSKIADLAERVANGSQRCEPLLQMQR